MKPGAGGLPTQTFLGVEFAAVALPGALDWVRKAAGDRPFVYVVTPNVDHVVMLDKAGTEPWRSAYREAVEASDLCINDSRVLARLAGLSNRHLDVVPGSDLTRDLLSGGLPADAAVTLVGGNAREAAWLAEALPGHRIAHHEPPMGVRDNPALHDSIAEFVEAQAGGIVFLAMGAPQSEIVARHIAQRGKARGVGLCIGASIEFLSGTRQRAPRWMQRAGIEWLHRLLTEPRRLWRRYLVEGPQVFRIWWRHRREG